MLIVPLSLDTPWAPIGESESSLSYPGVCLGHRHSWDPLHVVCLPGLPCPGEAGSQWVSRSICQAHPSVPTGSEGASLKPVLWGPGHLPPGLPGLPVRCRCGWYHRGRGEGGPWAGGTQGCATCSLEPRGQRERGSWGMRTLHCMSLACAASAPLSFFPIVLVVDSHCWVFYLGGVCKIFLLKKFIL